MAYLNPEPAKQLRSIGLRRAESVLLRLYSQGDSLTKRPNDLLQSARYRAYPHCPHCPIDPCLVPEGSLR